MGPTVTQPKKYLYEKAHEAAVTLRLAWPLLSASQRETLEILADPKAFNGITKGISEAKKGMVVPLGKIFS